MTPESVHLEIAETRRVVRLLYALSRGGVDPEIAEAFDLAGVDFDAEVLFDHRTTMRLCGFSKSTFWGMRRAGLFPEPDGAWMQVSPVFVNSDNDGRWFAGYDRRLRPGTGWFVSTIKSWMRDRLCAGYPIGRYAHQHCRREGHGRFRKNGV